MCSQLFKFNCRIDRTELIKYRLTQFAESEWTITLPNASTFPFHPLTFVHSNQVLFPLCYWNCFCQGHLWTLSCQKQWLKFLSFHFSSVYHSGHILSPEAFSSLGFWEAAHLAFPLPFSTPFLSVFAGSSFFFLISPFCTHWVFSFSPQLGKALIHYWFWNICLQSQTLPSGPFL